MSAGTSAQVEVNHTCACQPVHLSHTGALAQTRLRANLRGLSSQLRRPVCGKQGRKDHRSPLTERFFRQELAPWEKRISVEGLLGLYSSSADPHPPGRQPDAGKIELRVTSEPKNSWAQPATEAARGLHGREKHRMPQSPQKSGKRPCLVDSQQLASLPEPPIQGRSHLNS